MNKRFNIIRKLVLILLSIITLFSCKSNISTEEVTIENAYNESVSKVANDPEFLNKLHNIRNPVSNTSMLVKGDGTIVLKTMEPTIEQIGAIEDVDGKTTNYIYKMYNGEGIETKTYGEGDSEYKSKDLTMRTVFYDKNGKEVGLTTNTYGAIYTSKYKIIYRDNSVTDDQNDLRVFDVNSKEISKLPYGNIYTFNGNFLVSTYGYSDIDEDEVTLVCDENLNELQRIEGYSALGVEDRNGAHIVRLSRKINDNNLTGEDNKKYNFLDGNYKFIFDEDVDEIIWGDTFPILTIRKGQVAFDFDFSKMERVSEDRPYVEEKTSWEVMMDEQRKYDGLVLKLEEDGKYQYVDVFMHDKNVYLLAYKDMNVGMFDNNSCDVYNDKLELIASFDSVDNVFRDQGYIFVNKNAIYNDNLEIIKKFDVKCNVEVINKFDRAFFSNGTGEDYSKREDFELYDENFNALFEHIDSLDSFVYDDYFVMTKNNNTYFVDKDFKIVKEIQNRALSVRGWSQDNTNYRSFVDLETERMGILDGNLQIAVDNLKDIFDLSEKYFTYQNGFKYGLMDYEGKPIITYSIFDTMREDAVEKDFDGEFVYDYTDY